MKRAANNLLGKVKHYGKKIEDWPTSVSAILSFLSLLVSLAALIIPLLSGDPDQTPLISLVEKEAKVAASGDVDSAVSLYADNAVVSDKGAPFGAQTQVRHPQVWEGKDQIRERYELIKRHAKFRVLHHTNITVTFVQNAKTASVMSQ